MIKFKASANKEPIHSVLLYNQEDYSFICDPHHTIMEYDIVVNYLSLRVVDNVVVEVSGLSPCNKWIPMNRAPKKYFKGCLKIIIDREEGFAYKYNDGKEWPEFVNKTQGWVCIGDPENEGEAVEFIKNCVAVLDNEDLVAIWLKPLALPQEIPGGLKLFKH